MVADSSATLRTLADRVEREAGSSELNQAICDVLFPKHPGTMFLDGDDARDYPIRMWRFPDGSTGTELNFTRSLDAAVTLVPVHYSYELTHSAAGTDGMKRARLWDWRRGPLMSDPGNEWKAEANTSLPSVLCAAALRAIAEGEAR